jgi:hypothetical protein
VRLAAAYHRLSLLLNPVERLFSQGNYSMDPDYLSEILDAKREADAALAADHAEPNDEDGRLRSIVVMLD